MIRWVGYLLRPKYAEDAKRVCAPRINADITATLFYVEANDRPTTDARWIAAWFPTLYRPPVRHFCSGAGFCSIGSRVCVLVHYVQPSGGKLYWYELAMSIHMHTMTGLLQQTVNGARRMVGERTARRDSQSRCIETQAVCMGRVLPLP